VRAFRHRDSGAWLRLEVGIVERLDIRQWHAGEIAVRIPLEGQTLGARALYNASPTGPQADANLDRLLASESTADANDVLYQLLSGRDYNPEPELGRITARVLAINSADDPRNPPELGILEKVMGRLSHGRYVLLPLNDASRGHGTTANVQLWKSYLADVLSERN
jgi:homoserine O-acetyltransferase